MTGSFRQDIELGRVPLEQRSIRVLTPLQGFLHYPHVAQVFRVTRRPTDARQNGTGKTSREYAYGITPAPASRATPEQLLAYNRGHCAIEVNHLVRDKTFGEDACLARTRFAPANNATCTNIALAIIIHQTSFKNSESTLIHTNVPGWDSPARAEPAQDAAIRRDRSWRSRDGAGSPVDFDQGYWGTRRASSHVIIGIQAVIRVRCSSI